MALDRTKFKGTDILHLKYFRIESEFNELLRFYEFIDTEIKLESVRIKELVSEPNSFEKSDDEDLFYSMIESESDLFNEYFPQISMKYAFIAMFGLFENYFKNFILISKSRKLCKGILDNKLRKDKIIELKKIINNTSLHTLKTEFICENVDYKISFSLFDTFWLEFSKLQELRNSIIHNDSDVSKEVGKHWSKVKPAIKNLEQFIYEYFKGELLINEKKFFIVDKKFLPKCKSLYLNLLNETKKIIIN